MKLAWTQIILSLILGFALGITFDALRCNCNCPCACFGMKHFKAGFPYKHKDFKCHMIQKLTRELNLTQEQKTKVAEVFKAKQGEMLKIKEEIRPRFEALRQSTNSEIKKFLTPEQQKKLDALDARMESMHKKMHGAFSKEG